MWDSFASSIPLNRCSVTSKFKPLTFEFSDKSEMRLWPNAGANAVKYHSERVLSLRLFCFQNEINQSWNLFTSSIRPGFLVFFFALVIRSALT